MAGNVRFHSKYHAKSHHTNTTPGYFDSATDPIASPDAPFQGDFIVNGTLSATNFIAQTTIIEVISAGAYATSVKAVTGNYSVLTTDQVLLLHGGAGGSLVYLPSASAVPNQEYTFKRTSETTTVSLCAQGSDLIENEYSGIILAQNYATAMIVSYDNRWWLVNNTY